MGFLNASWDARYIDVRRYTRERAASWFGDRGASASERTLATLTTLVVATGLFLRIRGYLFQVPAFWLDECGWAMMLVEGPLRDFAIRPLGFTLVSQAVGHVFGLTEPALRALPWLSGMATTLLAVPLSRRLFRAPAARLLFVFVLALHPCAIDFSKEFKPYSTSLLLHLTLLLLTLLYLETKRARHLSLLLAFAAGGGLFAQDLLFAYPGVFVVAGLTALRQTRRQLVAVLATAVAIVLVIATQYLLLWRYVTRDDVATFAEKYSTFYTPGGSETFARWAFRQALDMASFPGFRRTLWSPGPVGKDALALLAGVDQWVWMGLHVAGLVVLVRRKRVEGLLLLLPLCTLWAFNLLRIWPIGVFRSNIFLLVYMAGIACTALEHVAVRRPRFLDALPALLLVFLPLALLDRNWSARKQALTYSSDFPDALKQLLKLKRANGTERETLLLDRRSCDPFRFYSEFHPRVSRRLRGALETEFDARCIDKDEAFRQELDANTPARPQQVWAILHSDRAVHEAIRSRALGSGRMRLHAQIGTHIIVAFSQK